MIKDGSRQVWHWSINQKIIHPDLQMAEEGGREGEEEEGKEEGKEVTQSR